VTDLAIIVPVIRRPAAAPRFMASLAASSVEVPVYAITDQADSSTRRAWLHAGATVMTSTRGHTFPQKAQFAYEHTTEPWLLLIGDDVDFKEGWFDHAAVWMHNRRVCLIATNDMHNPFVLGGTHATHPIIRRSWINDAGASWDGPGFVAHLGYTHACVDSEWSARAWEDDVFQFVEGCKIEHLHPTWGTGRRDPVYELGMKHYHQDHELFRTRQEKYAI